jgi:hypothetical protein
MIPRTEEEEEEEEDHLYNTLMETKSCRLNVGYESQKPKIIHYFKLHAPFKDQPYPFQRRPRVKRQQK